MALLVAAVPVESPAAITIADGAVTTGSVWSATVMVVDPVLALPAASVAVNTTVVGPNANWVGASVVIETLTSTLSAAATLSVADALAIKLTTAASEAAIPLPSKAATVVALGAVITGAV